MKVARDVVEDRRERLAGLLRRQHYMPLAELCRHLGISPATARRDLGALEARSAITRTYGGAFCEFDRNARSFQQRQSEARDGKRTIARAAAGMIPPASTCFLDAGTTIHALAEEVSKTSRQLTVVTNNLPVADALVGREGIAVHLIGGEYFTRQSLLIGPGALRSLRPWHFDIAFLGAEGMTADGLWNSQEDLVKLQRCVLARTQRVYFCVDRRKIGRRANEFLLPWTRVQGLITDAGEDELAGAGIHPNRPAASQ